jgi:uncharacterized protein involved in exopolysaccharide biosynthesis
LIPALVTVLAVGAYAMLRQPPWEASQALVIRNDAANNQEALGKFTQPDEMKTVQETILELVRSRSVLATALKEVGPPSDYHGAVAAWPTEEDVADMRETVKLTPPKGAEFGKTEVFYLKVRDPQRGRAVALVSALCGQLEASFQKLRDAKAASVVGELEKAIELAAKDLADSTARLSDLERQVGSDLAELRILHDTTSGESALRRTITEVQNELRQARAARQSNEQLISLLKLAQAEPDRLVAMPNTLLESQPGLRRLKDGLIDAQLAASQLLGRMSAEHPQVQAARESQKQIARDVHGELGNAIRAVEVDLRLNGNRTALLEEQLAATTGRLENLASLRAPYANQVAETRKRMDLMERAQQRLADARASHATAKAASLIARIDSPETGARPVGPGRTMLLAIGLAGGLVIGLGVLVLSIDSVGHVSKLPDSTPRVLDGRASDMPSRHNAGRVFNMPAERRGGGG